MGLGLNQNQIVDISPLSYLTNVNDLWLNQNQITDVSPLSSLINLNKLWLDQNQIIDISPLSYVTNLMGLGLNQNQIVDISPLSYLTNVNDLWLNQNQITDISPLSPLTNLTELWLNQNQIRDISSILSLTSLTNLYLTGNLSLTSLPSEILTFNSNCHIYLQNCGLSNRIRIRLQAAMNAPGYSGPNIHLAIIQPVEEDTEATLKSSRVCIKRSEKRKSIKKVHMTLEMHFHLG